MVSLQGGMSMISALGQTPANIAAQPVTATKPQFGAVENPANPDAVRLNQLAAQHPVLATMFKLIDIPSATPQKDPRHQAAVTHAMDRMRTLLTQEFQALGVTDITVDPNGSLLVRVPGSYGYENKRPLLLTAHMDIVAGDPNNPTRPIQRRIVMDEGREFIATDGTTTLGADDKGGIAMILDNVAKLMGKHPDRRQPIPHAPLELLFSPDEESSCDSLKKLDTSRIRARHAIVVDEFDPFKVTTGLASAVSIKLDISGLPGGHSGADIHKPNRINAIVLLSKMLREIGTGVIKMDPQHHIPLISKNIGLVKGGSAPNAIPETAEAEIFLRSGDKALQEKEIARIREIVSRYQQQYGAMAPNMTLDLEVKEEYPAWQGDPGSPIRQWATAASANMNGPKVEVGPIHAAAQASILANKTNAYGEPFDAALIGPYIKEAHTVRERVDWQSVVSGSRWLGEIIREYTRRS